MEGLQLVDACGLRSALLPVRNSSPIVISSSTNLAAGRSGLFGSGTQLIALIGNGKSLDAALMRTRGIAGFSDSRGAVKRSSWRASASSSTTDMNSEPQRTPPSSSAPPYVTAAGAESPAGQGNGHESSSDSKGWDDQRLLAQLRYLAVIADDRAVMHGDVAVQRDNWGKLIQVTVMASMIMAGILSALNTRSPSTVSFSLSLTASLLSAGSIVFMGLENWFQPAQLAEEQRGAARFFSNLVKEIQASLKPGGFRMQEDASLFYNSRVEKLRCLDRAFPLPLFPGGLKKFPKEFGPSKLGPEVDWSQPELELGDNAINGWSPGIVEDLKTTSELLRKKDIANYVSWQTVVSKLNKVLAISSPVLALASIVGNCVGGTTGAAVAAGSCVLAALCSSLSHDAQVGMIYEMYREVAGSFQEMDNEIQRNLRLPVEQRQNGELFYQKIALQLGRREGKPILSSDETASKLL